MKIISSNVLDYENVLGIISQSVRKEDSNNLITNGEALTTS